MYILIVEDQKYLNDALAHTLSKQKFTVDQSFTGPDGLEKASTNPYDAIVLDIILPQLSGLDILAHLRKKHITTPIIMLSALSEVEDKIKGLDYGADDYLAKPFKTAELAARLRALSRRPQSLESPTLKYQDLRYDTQNHTLNKIQLTDKEAHIIKDFLQNPEKLQNKSYLLSKYWSAGQNADNILEVYIARLRKILRKLNSKAEIKTIKNLGYKLCSKD
jgi:DNA-binding response OmpR family regulator